MTTNGPLLVSPEPISVIIIIRIIKLALRTSLLSPTHIHGFNVLFTSILYNKIKFEIYISNDGITPKR
jgi:hypothetical protein